MRDGVSMDDVWLAHSVVEYSLERDCPLTSASIVSHSNFVLSPVSERKVARNCRDPSHVANVLLDVEQLFIVFQLNLLPDEVH